MLSFNRHSSRSPQVLQGRHPQLRSVNETLIVCATSYAKLLLAILAVSGSAASAFFKALLSTFPPTT